MTLFIRSPLLIKALGATRTPRGRDDIAVRDAAGGPVMWWALVAENSTEKLVQYERKH
jgi:hypothetical protein